MAHYLRITAVSTIASGNTAVNTWHFSADGAGVFGISDAIVVGQANAAIQDLKAFYTTMCMSFLVTSWTIGATVTEHQTGQPTKFISATPDTVSGAAGVKVPTQLAAVASWKTGLSGRSNRGRTYLGPLANAALSSDMLNGGVPSAIVAAGNTLIAAPGSGDLVPCVYSPTLDQTRRITGVSSSNVVRTMRSRN